MTIKTKPPIVVNVETNKGLNQMSNNQYSKLSKAQLIARIEELEKENKSLKLNFVVFKRKVKEMFNDSVEEMKQETSRVIKNVKKYG